MGLWGWITGNQGTDNANKDREFIDPHMRGGSPYINPQGSQLSNQNALIAMLQNRANGNGPSLAGNMYTQAADRSMQQAASMSNSGTAGGTRAAVTQMGNINQGLAHGYAQARAGEMAQNSGLLSQAIAAADQSEIMRQRANQEAWLRMLDARTGLSRQAMGMKSNADTLGGLLQGAGSIAMMV